MERERDLAAGSRDADLDHLGRLFERKARGTRGARVDPGALLPVHEDAQEARRTVPAPARFFDETALDLGAFLRREARRTVVVAAAPIRGRPPADLETRNRQPARRVRQPHNARDGREAGGIEEGVEPPRFQAVLVPLRREAVSPPPAGGLLLLSPARDRPGGEDTQAFADPGRLFRGGLARLDPILLVRAADDRKEIAEPRPHLVQEPGLARAEIVALLALAPFRRDGVVETHRVRRAVGVDDPAERDRSVEGIPFHRDLAEMLEKAEQQVLFREGVGIAGLRQPLPRLRLEVNEPLEKVAIPPGRPEAALPERAIVETLDLGGGRDLQPLHRLETDHPGDLPVLVDEVSQLEGGV